MDKEMLVEQSSAPEEAQNGAQQEAVMDALQRYQNLLQTEVTLVLQDTYEKQVCIVVEEIFYLIEPNLRRCAARNLSSARARQELGSRKSSASDDTLQVLSFDMFSYLLPELPDVKPDPNKNVVGYLVTIADRSWRKDPVYYSRRPSPLPLDTQTNHPALVDESTMASIDNRIQYQTLRQHVEAFRATLAPTDRWILDGRIADPIIPYAALAQKLGAGYTDTMLRKRWSRLRKQLQEYLEENNGLELGG